MLLRENLGQRCTLLIQAILVWETKTWPTMAVESTLWGSTPAREVELVDEHGTVTFHDAIEPFRVSQSHPSILFLNLMVER